MRDNLTTLKFNVKTYSSTPLCYAIKFRRENKETVELFEGQ